MKLYPILVSSKNIFIKNICISNFTIVVLLDAALKVSAILEIITKNRICNKISLLVQTLKKNEPDSGQQQRGKKLSSGTSVQVCNATKV